MTPLSTPAVSAPAMDVLSLLGKSHLSSSAAFHAVNPTFETALGQAMSERPDPGKVNLPKVDGSRERAEAAADARAADDRVDAARVRRDKAERVKKEKPVAVDGVENSVDRVKDAAERAGDEASGTAGASAREEGTEQSGQKRASAKKAADPHGTEGGAPLGVREQVANRLLQGGALSVATTGAGQDLLSPEELLAQLAALGIGGGGAAGHGSADAVARPVAAAILPSASVATLAEMMAQVHAGDKGAVVGKESAGALGRVQPLGEGAPTSEAGLRIVTNSRGEPSVVPGATLSAHSPEFADELMDQVGRMRLLSRGGAPEQVRVTLDPEDLGTIDLRLRVDGQNQVHLLINTETPAARDLLQRQIAELREALARQDMGFGEVTIQVNDQQRDHHAAAQWGFAEQQERRGGSVPGDAGRRGVEAVEEGPRPVVSVADGVLSVVV